MPWPRPSAGSPFSSSTVAFGMVLAAWALAVPGPSSRADAVGASPWGRRWATRRSGSGMWLGVLPGLAFGLLEVLAPLRLDVLGASALAIGVVFLRGRGAGGAGGVRAPDVSATGAARATPSHGPG